MYIRSCGYASGYTPESVRNFAKQAAEAIPRMMAETGADAIVVSGNSGISIGHAALMLIEFPLVLVRKHKDNSHGRVVEGPLNHELRRYLILDDFVSSGATVRNICNTLYSQAKQDIAFAPKCVGILEYTRDWANGEPHNEVQWRDPADGMMSRIPQYTMKPLGAQHG